MVHKKEFVCDGDLPRPANEECVLVTSRVVYIEPERVAFEFEYLLSDGAERAKKIYLFPMEIVFVVGGDLTLGKESWPRYYFLRYIKEHCGQEANSHDVSSDNFPPHRPYMRVFWGIDCDEIDVSRP